MNASPEPSRLETELILLEAIYPGEISYAKHELKHSRYGASLRLRIPKDYPGEALPEIIAANLVGKQDVRDAMKLEISLLHPGEEILDAIMAAFHDLVDQFGKSVTEDHAAVDVHGQVQKSTNEPLTVVVFLHHLLNTNKRKKALSPSMPGIAGLSKPGYPGVLVYSGPHDAVREHISMLKDENWQAFQIRLEVKETWSFVHGPGVVELETMKEAVHEVGNHKDAFMEAMRMK